MFDMAWTSTTVDTGAWLDDWAVQRCGGPDAADAIAAWRLLAATVYADRSGEVYEHHMAYCPTWMPDGSGWDNQRGSEHPSWSVNF